MKKEQIGVIVPNEGMNIRAIKNTYIDRYTKVDSSKQKPLKITFDDYFDDETDEHWIEVWAE